MSASRLPVGARIAMVTPRFPPAVGGVERYVERLTSGLVERGVQVDVVTTDPDAGEPSAERWAHRVPVRRFPTIGHDRTYVASPRLARWLRANAHRYAILHSHSLHTTIPMAVAWAARRSGRPVVLTPHYHGTGHTPFRRLLHIPYRPLARRTVRAASQVIGNSVAECELLREHFGADLPITRIPEGVELPTGPGVTAAAPSTGQAGRTILVVGRLEHYKRVDRVVEALPHLPDDHRVVVVGDGPARAELEGQAARLGLEGRVTFRGRVPDDELAACYASADVAVALSEQESFGLVVLEAAALGAPVVVSDIPAFREVAAFAPPGRVTSVDADAGPTELARALRDAIDRGRTAPIDPTDPPAGWTLPTWDALVDATLEIYERALGGSGSAARTSTNGGR